MAGACSRNASLLDHVCDSYIIVSFLPSFRHSFLFLPSPLLGTISHAVGDRRTAPTRNILPLPLRKFPSRHGNAPTSLLFPLSALSPSWTSLELSPPSLPASSSRSSPIPPCVVASQQVTMAAARAMIAGCVSHLPQCVGGRQALTSTSSLSVRVVPLRRAFAQRLAVQSRKLQGCRVVSAEYSITEEGEADSLEYRLFFSDKSGKTVSPWHDIPLHAGDGAYNFIVEIPKETKAKMEVATEEPNTPIKQDTKKGKLRFYPYNINWNYGLFPQTWEDPSHSNSDVENAFGDNDPVDVVEIGERQAKMGEVLKVKPLAVLAMIDEGELDWKVVAISIDDPKADLVNNVADVEKHFPGTLTAIRDWFRDYKIPDGKPANRFGLDNKPADKDYTLNIIAETNEAWAKLVKRSVPAGELSLV